MADNLVINPTTTGGSTIAADDISSVYYPRGKLSLGADGAATDAIGVSAALDSDGTGVQAAGIMGQYDDAATATVTEDQFAPVRISSRRALLVEGVASGTGITVSDGGSTLSVDDGGSTVSVDDGGSSLTVDGTVAVSGTVTVTAAGDVAHDAADSGSPVKVGVKAASALPTAVADGDRANAIGDLFGRQLVGHIAPGMQVWKSANYTTTQTGAAIWDPTAGKKIAITSIVIGTYGTTAARLILWFGANGDTTYTAGTDQLVLAASFAPSATVKPGLVLTPPVPVFCGTADNELHITTDAAMSVDVAVYGYEW